MRPSSKIRRRSDEAAQLADASNLGGMGVWALGMDGNDPNLLAALAGFAPAVKDGVAGPSATTSSGPSVPPGPSGPTALNGGGDDRTHYSQNDDDDNGPSGDHHDDHRAPFPRLLHGYLAGAIGSPRTVSGLKGAPCSIRNPLRSSDRRLCHQ